MTKTMADTGSQLAVPRCTHADCTCLDTASKSSRRLPRQIVSQHPMHFDRGEAIVSVERKHLDG